MASSQALAAHYAHVPNATTYEAALTCLEPKGFHAIRVGHSSEDDYQLSQHRLPPSPHAESGFFESWLYANCEFMLAGATGAWWIASTFGRPVIFSDAYALTAVPAGIDLLLTKLVWHTEERRLLTFPEMARLGHIPDDTNVRSGTLEIIDNSCDDIAEVCLEMTTRLTGAYVGDEDLQARFWRAIRQTGRPRESEWSPRARLGDAFLNRNRTLIGD
jgi:putative glycosyltransferase (TIGR04372 family)